MKKLSIICGLALVLALLSAPGFGATIAGTYGVDVLESGNSGGWSGSDKTWDTSWTLNPSGSGETMTVDFWGVNAPENMIAYGVKVTWDDTSLIECTSAQLYGGGELTGPWAIGSPTINNSTGVVICSAGNPPFPPPGTPVTPDSDGDIILMKCEFHCLGEGTVTLSLMEPAGSYVIGENQREYDPTPIDFDVHQIAPPCTLSITPDDVDVNSDQTQEFTAIENVNCSPPDFDWRHTCTQGPPDQDLASCDGSDTCVFEAGVVMTEETCEVCVKDNNNTNPEAAEKCADVTLEQKTFYYVNGTDGDNANDGLTPSTAWKTITFALSQITDNSENNQYVIQVAASTYDWIMGGGDAETFPIYMKEYVSLQGDGYEDTIIDAEWWGAYMNNVIMFAQEDYIQHVTIDGFTITGGNAYGGGGIMVNWANPVISNCNVTGNIAWGMNGGGIYLKRSNAIISNCIIANNQAPAQRGGGISCGNQSHPIITNCTIVNNLAGSLEWEGGGGLFAGDDSNPTITNCIFWGNEGNDPTTQEDETEILARAGSGIVVNYSCIEDGWSGSGVGNISSDPEFLGTDDYHLRYGSPCIDAADGEIAPATDIDENARYDDPDTPDNGVGNPPYCDIGAYEYNGDSDGDGVMDDGDDSGTPGDNPCHNEVIVSCDDNCITTPNGPEGGTCTSGTIGEQCMSDGECGDGGVCSMNQEDEGDGDGVGDVCDNCLQHPNGLFLGTCARQIDENLVLITWNPCENDGDCETGEFCENNQLDSNNNDIGDACECESDFDCDGDQDWDDIYIFLDDWGRNIDYLCCPPCEPENEPCEGDFDGDCDTDWDDVFKFLEDWGRNPDNNPCPGCP